jgi:hypothetical protein
LLYIYWGTVITEFFVLSLDISLQKASMLYIYWGTVITELFSEVQKPWIEILEALKTGIWLNEFTLTIEKGIRFVSIIIMFSVNCIHMILIITRAIVVVIVW